MKTCSFEDWLATFRSYPVTIDLDESVQTAARYRNFMRATGLLPLIRNHNLKSLYDYLIGIEFGRHLSDGHQMENLVEKFLIAAGVDYSAKQAETLDGFRFVWITDGSGWRSARQNLRETFLVLRDLYNIRDLENGKFLELFK